MSSGAMLASRSARKSPRRRWAAAASSSSSWALRIAWRSANGLRVSSPARSAAEYLTRGVDDGDVIGSPVEHLDHRVDCDPLRPDLHGRLHDARDGALGRDLARDDPSPQDGVREDRQVLSVADEDRRAVVGRHQLRGAPDRDRALAEERGAGDQLGHADRPELGHRVHHVARPHEPVAERSREVGGSGRPGVERQRLLSRDEEANRLVASPHGEGRGEPAQERRLAEGLARPEQVDDLAVVDELDRALPDDAEVFRRRAVLDQNRGTRLVATLLGTGCDRLQLVRVERVERREPGEEAGGLVCVHRLHCSTSIPVLPVPCNKSLVLPASGRQQHSRQGGPIWRRTMRSSTTQAVA